MSSKLIKGILNDTEYNAGGISHIWLLNIEDFLAYQFEDDSLYDNFFVSDVFKENRFIELGRVDESSFSETYNAGIYKQELNSYIRTFNRNTIEWSQIAQKGRYLVVFRTQMDRYFIFGSDGGARLAYSEQTGQTKGVNGIQFKIEKSSMYPVFEAHADVVKIKVLGSEHAQYLINENNNETNILIEVL